VVILLNGKSVFSENHDGRLDSRTNFTFSDVLINFFHSLLPVNHKGYFLDNVEVVDQWSVFCWTRKVPPAPTLDTCARATLLLNENFGAELTLIKDQGSQRRKYTASNLRLWQVQVAQYLKRVQEQGLVLCYSLMYKKEDRLQLKLGFIRPPVA